MERQELRKKIYISGKITGNPDYMKEFEHAERFLRMMGYIPINPADVTRPLAESGANFSHDVYMDICVALLAYVDGIFMIGDWRHSPGAREELEIVLRKYPEYEILFEEQFTRRKLDAITARYNEGKPVDVECCHNE